MSGNSWIWKEAQALADRTQHKETVVFECGFGPSGLPHLGTFAEVARTTMVRRAFEELTGKKTELIVFSDDLDALRKVPENIPNRAMLKDYIGVAVSSVPNPFDTEHQSYSDYNNAKLREFLDSYGFDYTFVRASDLYYGRGRADHLLGFDKTVPKILRNAHEIAEIVTHDYSPERKETYCPIIPIGNDGKQVFEIMEYEYIPYSDYGTVHYKTVDGTSDFCYTTNPYGGNNFKFQWKVDWAMRWMALGVDYEMHGKDLLGSAAVGQRICKLLNMPAPLTFMYELFLDVNGEKISKSKGNGLEFGEWVNYAPADSLQWFLFQNPRKSRKLFLGMVPNTVDSFLKELDKPLSQDSAVWAIYGDNPPAGSPVSYAMLLNLVNIANTSDKNVLWQYVRNYAPEATPLKYPLLDVMIRGAIRYYVDRIEPTKQYRTPTDHDKQVLCALADGLEAAYASPEARELEGKDLAEYLMNTVYAVGKKFFGENKSALREDYFKMLYQVLMGQDSGPRFGQFAVIYGVENTIRLLRTVV